MAPRKLIALLVLAVAFGIGFPVLAIKQMGLTREVVVQAPPVHAPSVVPSVVAGSTLAPPPPTRQVEIEVPTLKEKPWLADVKPTKTLYVAGVLRQGPRVRVVLTDGRVYTHKDDELRRVDDQGAVIEGARIYFKPFIDEQDRIQKTDTVASGMRKAMEDKEMKIVEEKAVPPPPEV